MIPSVLDFPYSMFAPLSYTFDQVLWKFLFSFKKENFLMKRRQSCYFDLFGSTVFSVRSVYGFFLFSKDNIFAA